MVLRELFAKLGLDVDAQSFAKGNLAVEAVKFGLGKLVDAAEEVVGQFVENVKATAEYGHEIERTAQMTGLATDELQRLQKAGKEAGVSNETLSHGLILLSRTMAAAKAGGEEQAATFKKVGVAYKNADGTLRSAGDVLGDLADHFESIPDGAEKTALAMQLLGRSGAELIPLLNLGGEKIEELGSKATVMTEEQIAASTELVKTQRALEAQTKSLWRTAIAPLLPAITALLKQYLAWKKANNDVMKQRIQSVLGVAIKGVKLLGATFAGALKVIQFFKDNWKAVVALVVAGVVGWGIANAGLVASFVVLEAKAAWAARSVVYSWLKAAAPFIAVAAAVAAVLLLFDDYRTYQEEIAAGRDGSRTVFGKLKTWSADLFSDKDKKTVWWIEALKNAVYFATHLREVLSELKKDLEDFNTVKFIGKGLAANFAAPFSAAPGEETDDQRAQRIFGISTQAPAVPTYTPRAPSLPPGAGVNLNQRQTNEINVYAAPGQSAEDVADLVDAKIRESWDDNLEAAGAAAPAPAR